LRLKEYGDASEKWVNEKCDLNETLRNKLEEINLLHIVIALERDKYAKVVQVRDDLITKCDALVAQVSTVRSRVFRRSFLWRTRSWDRHVLVVKFDQELVAHTIDRLHYRKLQFNRYI
jgi:hypothetical protein